MSDGSDFARYVDARWPDLVGGLEDEAVPGDEARLAVAETLLASRRSWDRRVREEQVDVAVCHLAGETQARALAEKLTDRLADNLSGRAVGVAEVPSVLGAHVGPGLVGVTVARR